MEYVFGRKVERRLVPQVSSTPMSSPERLIVTNKPYYLAVGVVATMGWNERCAILLGADSLPKKKPDPDQVLHACERLGVTPQECVYVGDDERDIVAARAAGMKSVAALWGYREAHEDPADWRPDASADLPRDLLRPGLLAPGDGRRRARTVRGQVAGARTGDDHCGSFLPGASSRTLPRLGYLAA